MNPQERITELHKVLKNVREEISTIENKLNTSDDPTGICLGKKKSSKRNACLYCGNLFCRLFEHLLTAHNGEDLVKAAALYPRNTKQRRDAFAEIAAAGNFKHNESVLKTGGELILRRSVSSKETVGVNDVVPCSYCNNMYRKTCLYRHRKKCPKKPAAPTIIPVRDQAVAQGKKIFVKLCEPKLKISDLFRQHLLLPLREDDVKEVIVGDQLLQEYGETELNKCHDHKSSFDALRQRMRNLARFLIVYQKVANRKLTLAELFEIDSLNHLQAAAKEYSHGYTSPYNLDLLQASMGHVFKVIKLNTSNRDYFQDVLFHQNKFDGIWSSFIRPNINNAKTRFNMFRKLEVPQQVDIKKISDFINKKISTLMNDDVDEYNQYRDLCRCVVAKLTIFNFRRSGEVARMTCEQFLRRQTGDASHIARLHLTEAEKTMAKYTTLVVLKGKSASNPLVGAILPPDCLEAMLHIEKVRNTFIPDDNPYLFARSGVCNTNFDGYTCIRDCVKAAGIQNTSMYTSCKMRKYIATEMLWFNITETQRKLLCKHLGHDLSTHNNVYMENMNTAIFSVVPTLLLAAQKGITVDKPYNELTPEDVREFIIQSCVDSVGDEEDEQLESEEKSMNDEQADKQLDNDKSPENPLNDEQPIDVLSTIEETSDHEPTSQEKHQNTPTKIRKVKRKNNRRSFPLVSKKNKGKAPGEIEQTRDREPALQYEHQNTPTKNQPVKRKTAALYTIEKTPDHELTSEDEFLKTPKKNEFSTPSPPKKGKRNTWTPKSNKLIYTVCKELFQHSNLKVSNNHVRKLQTALKTKRGRLITEAALRTRLHYLRSNANYNFYREK